MVSASQIHLKSLLNLTDSPLTFSTKLLEAFPTILLATQVNCPVCIRFTLLILRTSPEADTATPGSLWVTRRPSLYHLMVGGGYPLAWQLSWVGSSSLMLITVGFMGLPSGKMGGTGKKIEEVLRTTSSKQCLHHLEIQCLTRIILGFKISAFQNVPHTYTHIK